MIKQFLEGFAIGAIFRALGQSASLWILAIFVMLSFGTTLLLMKHNGTDFTLLGIVLGYLGTAFFYIAVFGLFRFLLKNLKHLSLFLIFMAIVSYQPALLGGSYLNATLAFMSVIVALGIVYLIDNLINKRMKRKQVSAVS